MPFKEGGGETKFSEIASAFGGKKPHSMSEYYKNGRYIQDRLNYINCWPDGETTFTHNANTQFLIRAVVQPAVNERIKLTGKREYADGNQATITEVTAYRDTVDNFAGLPVATQEFYGDVYRIKCNKTITFGLNSYDTAGHGEEFERFSRGNFLITRVDSKYTNSDMEDIRFNPSPNLPSQDYSKNSGTEITVSNLHGAYDKTTTQARQTTRQTNRTTAGAANTSFTTSFTTNYNTTAATTFNTTRQTNKATSNNTTAQTSFSTSFNTSRTTTWITTFTTNFGIYGHDSAQTSQQTSKLTTFSTSKNTTKDTVKVTNFQTYYNTTFGTSKNTSVPESRNTSRSTARDTSGITTFNTNYNTTTSFWE